MVTRILLIVNRSSGTGCSPALVGALMEELRQVGGWPEELEVALVEDHPGARLATRSFLAASSLPAAVIVGAGAALVFAIGLAASAAYASLPAVARSDAALPLVNGILVQVGSAGAS